MFFKDLCLLVALPGIHLQELAMTCKNVIHSLILRSSLLAKRCIFLPFKMSNTSQSKSGH